MCELKAYTKLPSLKPTEKKNMLFIILCAIQNIVCITISFKNVFVSRQWLDLNEPN
jgi:hypothetical protein